MLDYKTNKVNVEQFIVTDHLGFYSVIVHFIETNHVHYLF